MPCSWGGKRRTASRSPAGLIWRELQVDMSQQPALDRLRVLVEAGIALSSELSLDALLQQLVETASELTEARYAALGVIDQSGKSLERFLTTGIDGRRSRRSATCRAD